MKEFIVSIDLITEPISNKRFSELFGIHASEFDVRTIDRLLLWRIESGIKATSSLTEHIDAVLRRAPIKSSDFQKNHLFKAAHLNIAILFDSATCTIDVPYNHLQKISNHGIGLSVSYYLAQEEVGDN